MNEQSMLRSRTRCDWVAGTAGCRLLAVSHVVLITLLPEAMTNNNYHTTNAIRAYASASWVCWPCMRARAVGYYARYLTSLRSGHSFRVCLPLAGIGLLFAFEFLMRSVVRRLRV